MKKWLIAAIALIGFFRLQRFVDGRTSLHPDQEICQCCNMREVVWHICDR